MRMEVSELMSHVEGNHYHLLYGAFRAFNWMLGLERGHGGAKI